MYAEVMSVKNSTGAPADTSPEVWRMQMKAVGALTPAQRLELWAESQKQFAIMEESAMRRLHPNFNEHQILFELVRARYGDELASKMVDVSLTNAID